MCKIIFNESCRNHAVFLKRLLRYSPLENEFTYASPPKVVLLASERSRVLSGNSRMTVNWSGHRAAKGLPEHA